MNKQQFKSNQSNHFNATNKRKHNDSVDFNNSNNSTNNRVNNFDQSRPEIIARGIAKTNVYYSNNFNNGQNKEWQHNNSINNRELEKGTMFKKPS